MKVKVIGHDGYKDWTVCEVSEVEVDNFSAEELMKTLDDEWEPNDYERVVTKKDVISVMGEEAGYTFVKLT